MARVLTMVALLGAVVAFGGCDRFDPARPPACYKDSFEGQRYSLCEYRTGDPTASGSSGMTFHLAWKGRDGLPIGSLPALKTALGPDARRVLFAMNAGMYHPDQRPVGLLIEDSVVLAPLETAPGQGNFYDQPNGVFWIDDEARAHLEDTATFAAAARQPVWATQSGPLLLRNGVIHPIAARGRRKAVRNAVIACRRDQAAFVISDGPVTLDQFARYIRDHVRCNDALYLDGVVSVLWARELNRLDTGKGLGPMLYVLEEP